MAEYTLTDIAVARISRRDSTGAIDYENAEGAVYIGGAQELTWDDEIEQGEEFLEKTGNNTIGYYDREDDLVKYSSGQLVLTRASWAMYDVMEVGEIITVPGDGDVGIRAKGGVSCGASTAGRRSGSVLEAWGRLKECSVAGSGTDTIFRAIFPLCRWTRGSNRMGRGPSLPTFNFTALPGKVGLGPFLDLPPQLDFPTDIDPYPWALMVDPDNAIPTIPVGDYAALPVYAS